jgi:hypothetical protein
MKAAQSLLAIACSLSVSCVAFADRQLDRTKILHILQTLTEQPRTTWISTGTIKAIHQEYRAPVTTDEDQITRQITESIQQYQASSDKRELTTSLQKMRLDAIPFNVRYKLSNEYTMTSTVTVKYDGGRFYWEINVDSRTDSVKPDRNLADNYMTNQFDLQWNKRRVFVWDGQEYTTYALPGNHVIVDATGNTPRAVSGPLTAGLIPWGYGRYSYEQLCAAESSAHEKYVQGQRRISLTVNSANGSEMVFVLDPSKDYAVVSSSVKGPENATTQKAYSNYRLVGDNWVPKAILIERYDSAPNRLLASDFWDLTVISGEMPEPDSFEVPYEPDALAEYCSGVTDGPLMYRYSDVLDTDLLLLERLTFAAAEAQNCGTIALEHVASQFGKQIPEDDLAELISQSNKSTSLFAMKQCAQGLGLYCRAVKTDIQTLKNLSGCEAILHIPGKNHFVVLGYVDHSHVWTIDLSDNKFLYRTDLNFFELDWTEGVALLVSDQPIEIQGSVAEIGDVQLENTVGGDGYTCTRLLQLYDILLCDYVMGQCGGWYELYYERYGCEAAASGSCTGSRMIRFREAPCFNRIDGTCDIGEWTFYYMRACK